MTPDLSSFSDILRENAELKIENACLKREETTLKQENECLIADNLSINEKCKEYMYHHPQRVGVKNGKVYDVIPPTRTDIDESPEALSGIKKKPGGQPGHKGHIRKRPVTITKTETIDLDQCPHCGSNDLIGIQETRTRTIEDLPIPQPEVTEYTIHRRYCKHCKKMVEGQVLSALPQAKLGLNLMLIVVWLKIGMRLTEEAIPRVLEQLCGIRISEGEVSHIRTMIATEFGEYYAQLEEDVRDARARYIDETSWRKNGRNLCMWAFVTKGVALYKIAHSRGHEVPLGILGHEPNGIDIHDRFRAYDKLQEKTGNRPLQLCWFHILSDSKDLTEIFGKEGATIHDCLKEVFAEAKQFEHNGSTEDVDKLVA